MAEALLCQCFFVLKPFPIQLQFCLLLSELRVTVHARCLLSRTCTMVLSTRTLRPTAIDYSQSLVRTYVSVKAWRDESAMNPDQSRNGILGSSGYPHPDRAWRGGRVAALQRVLCFLCTPR